ncbi:MULTISPECIES: hypothetical protein [Chryseobacterium]|jgi:hypothetical protein|uniref:Lipoprotein n=1 Tax=Chryseobacterium lathyri TaxID=395933 RepID=A0A511Y8T3_9FLAO|nr:hypothetical protein [Chryseobacterium lathyri]GEN71611.1 hypothetical protein CLA01_16830 [Chryseobacterium lathyri]
MKIFRFLLLLAATIALTACGTSHNYTNNSLNKNFYAEKPIYFKLNPKSQTLINFTGMHGTVLGGVVQPNVKETFQLSLNELANETNVKLKFIENSEEITDKDALVFDADISEINWHFGFSVATLKTVVNYKNISNNKEIQTTGIRKSGGGDEKNNLKKSLKDATYNFLKEYEKL